MIEETSLSREEFDHIAYELRDKHALFYALWHMGSIQFSDKTKTCSIQFNESGDPITFLFNKEFWDQSTEYDRLFAICHEALHVALNHGTKVASTTNPTIANMALDLVVNHTLVNRFGFNRDLITNWKNYCWIDTVFPPPTVGYIDDQMNFEYYFNELSYGNLSEKDLVDDHAQLINKDSRKKNEEVISTLNGILGNKDKEEIKDLIKENLKESLIEDKDDDDDDDDYDCYQRRAGTEQGTILWTFEKTIIEPKKQWKNLVKKWTLNNKHVFAPKEQWARVNRRFTLVSGKGLFLPSTMETHDSEDKNKIQAWFFLDVSGSCIEYKDYFFKVIDTVPQKFFDIKLHTFDTHVAEIDFYKRKVYGGGGTSFDIIEYYIQRNINGKKYPEIVFVLTDGEGTQVKPQIPKNWYWLLVNGGSKDCYPRECNTLYLKDFVGGLDDIY